MTKPPACLDCTYDGQEFPCRKNGEFDCASVARAYVTNVCADQSGKGHGADHWSFGCMDEIIQADADTAWETIAHAVGFVSTRFEVASLAAGALEDLITHQGSAIIDRLELAARQSPRFRYVLTGVWPQGNQGTEVWMRVQKARTGSPTVDETDQIPEF